MPTGQRGGGDARVRMVDITPAHRQHRVDDVIMVTRQVPIQLVKVAQIPVVSRRPAGIDQHATGGLDALPEGRCGDMRNMSAFAQSHCEVDGVSLRSATGGVSMEDGEKNGQDGEDKRLLRSLRPAVLEHLLSKGSSKTSQSGGCRSAAPTTFKSEDVSSAKLNYPIPA
jgi:hypothetical protein